MTTPNTPRALLAEVLRCRLLGVRVDALTVERFYALIRASVTSRQRCLIGHHNLHSVALYHRHAEMRVFYALADAVFIDGMPLVAWGRLLGLPLRHANRFTSVDWLPPLLGVAAEEGWRVYYLGGTAEVAERGAQIVRARFPSLVFTARHGYFPAADPAVNRAIVEAINAWGADVLLVGMGMPRQERWLAAHAAALRVPCMLTVGAALDYVAGAIPTPPRAMSRLGLEWLGRLLAEPGRLGYRYLVEPWALLPRLAADVRARARGELRCTAPRASKSETEHE